MPTLSLPGFLGPAAKGQTYMASAGECKNWYLEPNPSPAAPNPWCLVPCPGFLQLTSVTEAPIRATFYQRGRGFFLAGFAFYELLRSDAGVWSTTLRGTVNADTNPGTISANGDAGDQLWVTSGGVGYVYDLTAETLTVQGPAGTTVTMGGFLAARFLSLDADTGAFYCSALYDGTSWPGALVFQSESGDPWRALVVTPDGLIRLFGESTSEVWAPNPNSATVPFQQIPEASIPYGIVSAFAWAVDESVTWLGQNTQGHGVILRARGYTPVEVSTPAIATTIQGFDDLSDTTAFAYQEHGHRHVTFTFPDAGQSWTFDESTQVWHERASWNTTTGVFQAYRPCCAMEAFGLVIVGDRSTGALYQLSSSLFTDVDGAMIRRVLQAPRFSVDQRRVTVHALQVLMDVGQGLATGQGSDPQLMLQVSKDGGQTFSDERWSAAGPIGAFSTRVRWNRLGQGENFTPRFIATDPVPWRIVDCLIECTVDD